MPDSRSPGNQRRPYSSRGGPRRDEPRRDRSSDQRGPRLPRGVEIVYEDRGLLALLKPAGLLDAGRGPGATLADAAARLLRLPPRTTPTLLTRLDQRASGVVVIAKDRGTAERMQGALRPRRAHRTYAVVVEGVPEAEEGTLHAHLRRSRKGTTEIVPQGEPTDDGAPGSLHYRVEASGNGLTLLRVRTESDLPEQVRCQLSAIGHPIVGDRAYNATRDDLGRLGLHLFEIGFRPQGGGRSIRGPFPSVFREALESEQAHLRGEDPRTRERGWDNVAEWYDELVSARSDHHDRLIHPGVTKLLAPTSGKRILDVACGQGALIEHLLSSAGDTPPVCTGVDLAPQLIEAARTRLGDNAQLIEGDARSLDALGLEPASFDAATCVLALMNIDPIAPVLSGISSRLRPGGSLVIVLLHPAFRIPRSSDWTWEEDDSGPIQLRRIARYAIPHAIPIIMNPGEVASGAEPIETMTHHRPLGVYVSELARAGFTIDALEEWASDRHSDSGPRADAENTARREFPLFAAIRAVRSGD